MRRFLAGVLFYWAALFTIGIIAAVVNLIVSPNADALFSLIILLPISTITWWGGRKLWRRKTVTEYSNPKR